MSLPVSLMLIAVCGTIACKPKPVAQVPTGDRGKSPPPPAVAVDSTVVHNSTDPKPIPQKPTSGPQPKDNPRPIRLPAHGPSVNVADVVASSSYNGKVLTVVGRCRGAAAGLATGSPPSRSAWVFESDGAFIYVVGPFPPGCSITTPSASNSSFQAKVVEDTVTGMRDDHVTPRRYLERLR